MKDEDNNSIYFETLLKWLDNGKSFGDCSATSLFTAFPKDKIHKDD